MAQLSQALVPLVLLVPLARLVRLVRLVPMVQALMQEPMVQTELGARTDPVAWMLLTALMVLTAWRAQMVARELLAQMAYLATSDLLRRLVPRVPWVPMVSTLAWTVWMAKVESVVQLAPLVLLAPLARLVRPVRKVPLAVLLQTALLVPLAMRAIMVLSASMVKTVKAP